MNQAFPRNPLSNDNPPSFLIEDEAKQIADSARWFILFLFLIPGYSEAWPS
jgi:hypothetical protein